MAATAIFTDLDDTFVHPNDSDSRWEIAEFCKQHNWKLVIVTGNDWPALEPRLASKEFPYPDAIIAQVGTDIWYQGQDATTYQRDEDFRARLAGSGFRRQEIVRQGEILVAKLAADFPQWQLEFQPWEPAPDQPYKVSFYFTASTLNDVASIERQSRQHFAPYRVIISEHTSYNRAHPDRPTRYCADVVPTGKAEAVTYIAEKWSVTKGIVAGDSGNDVDMLLNTPPQILSVLVADAKPEAVAAIAAATTPDLRRGSNWRLVTNQPRKYCYVENSGFGLQLATITSVIHF